MRKSAVRVLLAAAAVLGVFIGKGSEAKAYEVVGGVTYMTWNEYEAVQKRGGVPEGSRISDAFQEGNGAAVYLMPMMEEYVPSWCFDYDWYLERHPELVEVCGNDKNAIYSFYANTGQVNGWYGRIAPGKLVGLQDFDYMRYAAENPDVAAALGQDAVSLYNHYVNNGIKEGRGYYSTDDEVNAYLKIYEVSSEITNPGMSDEERIKAVHDWMCLNIAYDYENYLRDTIPDESFDVTGAMNKGIAVCNGYAVAFDAFMGVQGIECSVVEGTGNGGLHAWNRVKLGGEYYYLDVTWDDPVPDVPGRVRYKYYLTKDSSLGGTHLSFEDENAALLQDGNVWKIR